MTFQQVSRIVKCCQHINDQETISLQQQNKCVNIRAFESTLVTDDMPTVIHQRSSQLRLQCKSVQSILMITVPSRAPGKRSLMHSSPPTTTTISNLYSSLSHAGCSLY